MPREVFLAPGGSPFVQSTTTRQDDTDTSLPDMSSRYFRASTNPEDLNSSRALAGLEDISADMEDDSPMRFRASVSDELLMGIKGGEFLADDSAMGFDTSLVAKPFDSRPKLMDSTSIPPAVSEEPEEEKPKRKKSTRSRSKSPSKKSVSANVAVDAAPSFPSGSTEPPTEDPEPEPQPEPEAKPRRTSPRKARTTRPPSSSEAPPAFSITPSNSTSNPFSSPPVADSTPVPPEQPTGVDTQVPQTNKAKRTSRTTGRSKSKSRSKNVPAEIGEESPADPVAPAEPERSSPPADQHVSPLAEASQSPALTNKYLDIANEQAPMHIRTEPAPTSAPFKFQTEGLVGNYRSKSPTPSVSIAAPVDETPSLDISLPEPTEEEEAEAVASALRILRRDSSIFPRLRQSIAPSPIPDSEPPSAQEGTSTREVPTETSAEPVHKRTRVGRTSTRARGASVAGRTRMNQAVEETQKPEEITPALEAPAVHPEGRVEDVTVPVNFGSRTPSPVPVFAPAEYPIQPEPEPRQEPAARNIVSDTKPTRATRTRSSTALDSSAPAGGAKPRVTRVSLPAQTTRTARMSERGSPAIASARSSKPKEPELVEEKEEDQKVEEEVVPVPSSDVPAPVFEPTREDVAQSANIPSPEPLEPTPAVEAPIETEAETEPQLEQTRDLPQDLVETSPTPTQTNPVVQPKALGAAATKDGPQRTATKPPSKIGSRTPSGQMNNSTTQKPPSKTSIVAPAISKVATATARKPSPTTQKPPSTSGPTRVAVSQELKAGATKGKPEAGARPTRILPKRASASSREQGPSEPIQEEVVAPVKDLVDEAKDSIMEEPVKETDSEPIKAGPFEHKRPAFQPILARADSSSELSSVSDTSPPRPNKRRASPEAEPEQPVLDSPSKRVRFSADLEAGPTPRAGPSQVKPKPSIKPFTKPNFQLRASRPRPKSKPKAKRTLTRNDAVPSYAAPLKRNTSEAVEAEAETTGLERAPLSESRANTRSTTNKLKPTVPVEFTFRSELRMKPTVEAPLPNAVPIAMPMPDFAAAHAAAEATNLARRERAQAAFLAAQAELDSFRASKYQIGSETARRAAERAVFDAAMKVKEAEAERLRVEEKKSADEREAAEIKEMRKRMVPKANPVPEWYKHSSRNEEAEVEGN